MRLINVLTLDFEEVTDPENTAYAILSHTWVEGQEVSLQDWMRWRRKSRGWQDIATRSGLAKILGACEMTKKHRLDFLWVDTNCIDKLSSAELSEAINSMFKWYELSTICFTYLSDVRTGRRALRDLEKPSRWFTRGWTLQELLASRQIIFFDQDWWSVGTKETLSSTISMITSINEKYLDGSKSFRVASVAARMSWAASRQTSRREDMAYSLLGLFDINMPLLYGEGDGAFIRLQEEILKVSTDQTIFAWDFDGRVDWEQFTPRPAWVSVLAPFPSCFSQSGSIEKATFTQLGAAMETWSMTNLGLVMNLPLLATTNKRRFFAVLQCTEQESFYLCIPIIKVNGELIRTGWPPTPLPLCRANKQPPPVSVCLPRHHRYGSREEIWETPNFAHPPQLLVFILTPLVDYEIEQWVTTPGVELFSDYGLLSIIDHNNYEGVYIGFKRPLDRRSTFYAVVFSDPSRLETPTLGRKYYAYCQLWRPEEIEPSWKDIWLRAGHSDASIDLAEALSSLLTDSMKLSGDDRTDWTNAFMRTNPWYDLEAVSSIRENDGRIFPGIGYSSVLIRPMDHAEGF
ncbi:HET-domain-containing protein [Astrocystis sublimbata]|nr:HET-domain-containing protein [Astrocystis sublimbata]